MRREITCLFGIGFNDLVHTRYSKEKRLIASIIHETIIQIGKQHFLIVVLRRTSP